MHELLHLPSAIELQVIVVAPMTKLSIGNLWSLHFSLLYNKGVIRKLLEGS